MTIAVYAPLGQTVELSTGAEITESGATVLPTDEIINLLARGSLLTEDPTEVNPDPSPLPDSADGVVSLPLTSLAAQPSTSLGAIAASYGAASVLDGAEGFWLRDPASTTTPNVGTIVGEGTGRWKRYQERKQWVDVSWFGAKNDGVARPLSGLYANWAAISAAYPHIRKASGESDSAAYTRVGTWDVNDAVISKVIALCSPGGVTIHFPAGTYRITRPILFSTLSSTDNINNIDNASGVDNMRITGADSCAPWHPTTILMWDGPSTLPMVFVAASDIVVENLTFRVTVGKTTLAGVNIGWDTATARFVHGTDIRGCYFWADGNDTSVWVDGDMRYGVAIAGYDPGVDPAVQSNFEDCRISRCMFRSQVDKAITITGGQPFNTVIEYCRFWQYQGARPAWPGQLRPFGIAIDVGTHSADVLIHGCEFQSYAIVLYMRTSVAVSMVESTTEQCMQLVSSPGISVRSGPPLTIIGGRHFTRNEYPSVSSEYLAELPAYSDFIQWTWGSPIVLKGLYVHASTTDSDHALWKMFVLSETPVDISGCTFPNQNCIAKYTKIHHVGSTWIRACRYAATYDVSGASYSPIPERTGTATPNGYVDFTGAEVQKIINTYYEPDNEYRVQLTPEIIAGTPTISTPYLSLRGEVTFRINLPTAPGVGNTIRVYYNLSR